MLETLPPARHASDSSDHEDDGQNRKNDDIEHDSVHHIREHVRIFVPPDEQLAGSLQLSCGR
jgi:hypothetical protein